MILPDATVSSLLAAFARHAQACPDEAAAAAEFAALLADVEGPDDGQSNPEESHPERSGREDPFRRERLAGHFTASAWLVDAAGRRLLMTHHGKLDRWLQLGGHADGDRDLAAVALREAEEESGLAGLVVLPDIFDLDRHWIPERGDVPGHWHYDVRYIVRATGSEDFAISDESHALAWREIDALFTEPGIDPSIVRMARKWVSRHV